MAVTLDIAEAHRDCARRCYALALRLLGDAHLAEDVVQEVFLTLSQHPRRFDPARGSPAAWLLTLTHHKAVDLIRRQQASRRYINPHAFLEELQVPTTAPGPDELACRSEDGRSVRAALRQLPERERLPLVLAYFGGLTQVEIAARLATPLGTVKTRMLSGMRRLATHLPPSDSYAAATVGTAPA